VRGAGGEGGRGYVRAWVWVCRGRREQEGRLWGAGGRGRVGEEGVLSLHVCASQRGTRLCPGREVPSRSWILQSLNISQP
jgi:hypothetical protein